MENVYCDIRMKNSKGDGKNTPPQIPRFTIRDSFKFDNGGYQIYSPIELLFYRAALRNSKLAKVARDEVIKNKEDIAALSSSICLVFEDLSISGRPMTCNKTTYNIAAQGCSVLLYKTPYCRASVHTDIRYSNFLK
jgi:hypothetical protein